MGRAAVTISIWQKPIVYKISWHCFLIAVTLMCWAVCPECPLFNLTDHWGNINAEAYTATLRPTSRFIFAALNLAVLEYFFSGERGREVIVVIHPVFPAARTAVQPVSVSCSAAWWCAAILKHQSVFASGTVLPCGHVDWVKATAEMNNPNLLSAHTHQIQMHGQAGPLATALWLLAAPISSSIEIFVCSSFSDVLSSESLILTMFCFYFSVQ